MYREENRGTSEKALQGHDEQGDALIYVVRHGYGGHRFSGNKALLPNTAAAEIRTAYDAFKRCCMAEICGFYGARFLSLVFSIVFMILLIDVLNWNTDLAKLLVTAFVILFNYVFSKCIVFRDREKNKME